MPYQSLGASALALPFSPRRAVACSSIEVPDAPLPRRAPWLDLRLGFVGSAEGFDLLRFEARTLALTPRTAPAVLAAGAVDALVVESAADALLGEWGLSFLDWAGATAQARALMRHAAEVRVPRVALMRGGASQAAMFAPLASEADLALVTDAELQDSLGALGVAAELVAPAMQPALHHGFAFAQDWPASEARVLSLDLGHAIDDPSLAAVLDGLVPLGLGLCSADLVARRHRVEGLPPALAGASLGTVTSSQLRELMVASDLLVQVVQPGRDPVLDVQHALHAAANRCAVAILGEVADHDPRRGFSQVFADPRDLRLFASRFVMDPLWAQAHMQAAWRTAHRRHSASTLAARLAGCLGVDAPDSRDPVATVVAPTHRPERLGQVLETFRAQTWPRRNLVVVANTDRPAEWDAALVRPEAGEQLAFLPRRFGPGAALNLGGARGRGDYVLRMDDDDRYGRHYVEDMMLAASALCPDVMGKPDCFYAFVDEDRLVWRSRSLKKPKLYPSSGIGLSGHLAGFTHVVRRSLMERLGYPDRQQGGADTAFLDALRAEGDLLCARADGLNAVVERRGDVRSHTWQDAPKADSHRFEEVRLPLAELLDGEAPPPYPPGPTHEGLPLRSHAQPNARRSRG